MNDSTTGLPAGVLEKLLTIEEAAAALSTGPRFPRRLIAERRIRYVHVGRFVRIPESAIREFIDKGTVEPRPARARRWVA